MAGRRYNNLGWFAQHPKLYEIGTVLLATLRRQAAVAAGTEKSMRILDIACGTGALSFELAKLGHEVTGIDLDQEMLKHATKKIRPELRLSFVHGDASRMSFKDNSFQAVTIAFSMHDVPYDIGVLFLEESKRVLTADGEITIIDYNEPIKNFLARILYPIAIQYESPNYALFVKRGLDKYLEDTHLAVRRRFTIFGGVQVVTCK
jgi:demethylmenaquinone methyltransferase/2-methoxy-6-polyprenyl-1,4-benzoquinol methylase